MAESQWIKTVLFCMVCGQRGLERLLPGKRSPEVSNCTQVYLYYCSNCNQDFLAEEIKKERVSNE